jgi:hypothetical protein
MSEFDAPVIRARITPQMIGADCLLMTDESLYSQMPYGELYNACIKSIPDALKRSYRQLGLYWACCKLVADNTADRNWNTAKKVDEQNKIAARHIEFWTTYKNPKTGVDMLHIKTRSIAFHNLEHIEACGYFTEAFQTMADKLGITIDELIENAKRKMRSRL